MAVADYLADQSAIARLHVPAVEQVLAPLLSAGRVATCGMVELEVLYSARNATDHAAVRELRVTEYEWLPIEDADFRRALDVQAELAGRGQHRAARLPDLVIAATAERHRVALLHYDADYELISTVTKQPMRWVVPRGSVP